MAQQFNVLELRKGEQHFFFIYDYDSMSTLLETLAEHARDKDLDFTHCDSARLSKRAVDMSGNADEESCDSQLDPFATDEGSDINWRKAAILSDMFWK